MKKTLKTILVILFVSSLSTYSLKAEAGYSNHYRKHGSILIQKSFYKDLKVTSGQNFIIQDTWDIELGYRFYRIFQFTLNASVGDQGSSDRTDYGLGLRVGLPGFFFLGARLDDVTRRRMKHPVNTSMYFINSVSTWKTASGSLVARTSAYRFGFSTDIFLYNPSSYLRLEAGIYNTRGNAHLSTSVGLGYEF